MVSIQVVTVGDECFRCAEAMFHSEIISGQHTEGIHTITHTSVMLCDPAIQNSICSHTVLSGGTTMLSGAMPL